MKKKVVVGMSGGVDSSVAAYLLKEQGYEVIGVTMMIWQQDSKSEDGSCCGLSAVEDARRVAELLEIPYYVMNFRNEFQEKVVDYFVEEYMCGRTPNPCIACNRYVKWEALLKRSLEIGADYIATGHYAGISRLQNGRYAICHSATAAKDQTYALYNLTQEQLAKTLMPLGAYTKDEIRNIAEKIGLPVASKPDSQEICFVPDNDYAGFIQRELADETPEGENPCGENLCGKKRKGSNLRKRGNVSGGVLQPGNFVTADGTVLGQHKGIIHYTVGQRRGLDLPMGERVFVTKIRPETNEVVIGKNEDIFTDTVVCDRVNFMSVPDLEAPVRVKAKIRYNHAGEYGMIEKLGDGLVKCIFEKPVRAATPGQAMVFYDGEHVLGGGTIL